MISDKSKPEAIREAQRAPFDYPRFVVALETANYIDLMELLFWVPDLRTKEMVPLKLNSVQKRIIEAAISHPRVCILKARQMGSSTCLVLLMLLVAMIHSGRDICLLNYNKDARGNLTQIINLALGHLHPEIAESLRPAEKDSKRFLFRNKDGDSVISATEDIVGKSTLTDLLASEFGYISQNRPKDSHRIIGAMEAIQAVRGRFTVIDTTAWGPFGAFRPLYINAAAAQAVNPDIGPKQWRAVFFPWYEKEENQFIVRDADGRERYGVPLDFPWAENAATLTYLQRLDSKLGEGKELTAAQKAFYIDTKLGFGGNTAEMFRQMPSDAGEAFAANIDGQFMFDLIRRARDEGRVGQFPPQSGSPVNVYFDLGIGAAGYTSALFAQRHLGTLRVIHEEKFNNRSVVYYRAHIDKVLHDIFHDIAPLGELVLPHDAGRREYSGMTFLDHLRKTTPPGWRIRLMKPLGPHGKRAARMEAEIIAQSCLFHHDGTAGFTDHLLACLESVCLVQTTTGALTDQIAKTDSAHSYDSFELFARDNISPFARQGIAIEGQPDASYNPYATRTDALL